MYVWRVAPDDDDLTGIRSLTRMPFEQLENVVSLSVQRSAMPVSRNGLTVLIFSFEASLLQHCVGRTDAVWALLVSCPVPLVSCLSSL